MIITYSFMFYDIEDTLFWMNDCWEEDVFKCCYEVSYCFLVLKLIININKGGLSKICELQFWGCTNSQTVFVISIFHTCMYLNEPLIIGST